MPKQKTDELLKLIKSLTRAEKRHFRLFVKRNQQSENILFLQLFDLLEKEKKYDEDMVLKRISKIKKRQLSNLKAHLYKQLLTSLRLLNKKNNVDIEVREMIDYARILYNKSFYRQALDILVKAKELALYNNKYALAMQAIQFEKLIEGQYITGSIEGTAEELANQSKKIDKAIYYTNRCSNVALQMYGLYLKVGFVKSKKDYYFVKEFFTASLPDFDFKKMPFYAKVFYSQAYVWYYHMLQEFAMSYRYAQTWVDLFNKNPYMKKVESPLYLKGLHAVLNALYNSINYKRFNKSLEELNAFGEEKWVKTIPNINYLWKSFSYIHNIRRHFMEGTFSQGLRLVPEIEEFMEDDNYEMDDHRRMVFYYMIACLYFGSGDNATALDYLNIIINEKNPDYRGDIQSFSRILSLIAHYELGNDRLVAYQIKSVYRFLSKMEDLNKVQVAILKVVRKLPRLAKADLKEAFMDLKDQLVEIEKMPYERRPFLYLDIISWLESKISKKPIQDIIREKYLKRQSEFQN